MTSTNEERQHMTDQHEHQYGLRAIMVELGPNGEMHIGGTDSGEIPEEIKDVLSSIRADMFLHQIRRHVTPQIASEVLWAYGDYDGTSEPSSARAALIQTIRLAAISDDEMLDNLSSVEDFHGYCIAVTTFMEDDDEAQRARGAHFLRHLAELETDCDAVPGAHPAP